MTAEAMSNRVRRNARSYQGSFHPLVNRGTHFHEHEERFLVPLFGRVIEPSGGGQNVLVKEIICRSGHSRSSPLANGISIMT